MTRFADNESSDSRSTSRRGRSLSATAAMVTAIVFAALLAMPAFASAAEFPSLLWQSPGNGQGGSGAGQMLGARAVAVEPGNGHLFVADLQNARIDEFDVWGQFVKAWGWGVVAAGPDNQPPQNERQELTVDATGGTYKLNYHNAFGGGLPTNQPTSAISFDASAASVQNALEGVESLDPGDVTVSGPTGGPYVIEFVGRYADSEIPTLTATSSLTGGAGTVTDRTLQNGGSFEICTPSNGDVCTAGQKGGNSPGQVPEPVGIAVDESGHVFVKEDVSGGAGETASLRVQKFDPDGNFSAMWGGDVDKTTGTNLCTKADVDGGDECGAGVPGTADGQFQESGPVANSGIAIGPTGTIFVSDVGRIQKFNPAGEFLGEVQAPNDKPIQTLAVNSTGQFYITYGMGALPFVEPGIYKLGSAGEMLATLGTEEPELLKAVYSLAVTPSDELYAVAAPPLQGNPALPSTPRIIAFNSVGSETIGPDQHFAESPSLVGIATSRACGIGGEDVYALNGPNLRAYGPPPDQALCPPPDVPPTISDPYATSVNADGAVVRALINPHFWPDTNYYVEYGSADCSSGGCEKVQPAAPGSLLTASTIDASLATNGVFLAGLRPATTYHYRFVAISGGGGPVTGPERTFTTFALPAAPVSRCPGNRQFRTGTSASLPDCRAYELVSPIEKNNGDILSLLADPDTGNRATLDQSSADGAKFVYGTYRAFGDAQSAPANSAYLATRTPQGWTSQGISPPRGKNLVETNTTIETQFKAFSPDLCSGWVLQESDALLAGGAVEGFPDLYRRENCGATAGTYQALTTIKPLDRTPKEYLLELQGVSADGSHAIFRATDSLSGTPDLGLLEPLLYESFGAGRMRLVCVLPNGSAVTTSCTAGTAPTGAKETGRDFAVSHAISADGSRIFWSEAPDGLGTSPGKIYVRINGRQTRAVSAEGEAMSGSEGAFYWTAAGDGSRAIFSAGSSKELNEGDGDLYSFELAGNTTTLIAHGVYGVLGASEDARRVYFLSKAALGGAAVAGRPNLYLYQAGAAGGPTFIATLSAQDALGAATGVFSPVNPEASSHTAQVSADGLQAVFMSSASLTGFDNTDQNSGQADAEVYRYDATTASLDCLSCNPTGARPSGRNILPGRASGQWAAARLPLIQTQLYPSPRALSADGQRVFFDSFEALVPADANGKQDVYEWEASGEGDCGPETNTFSRTAGGCVALISSGTSPDDSELVDASQSGDDAFISTSAGLLPQDPGLIDIYDARVGGGFPLPPTPPAACEGEACQGPPSPPADQTPASSSFRGAGNVREGAKKPGCSKGKVKKRKKNKCVKRHRRAHRKNKHKSRRVHRKTKHKGRVAR